MSIFIYSTKKIDGEYFVKVDEVQADLCVKNEALIWCKKFFLEGDRMNAALHLAPLKLSPITERVILALGEDLPKE